MHLDSFIEQCTEHKVQRDLEESSKLDSVIGSIIIPGRNLAFNKTTAQGPEVAQRRTELPL